MSGMAALVDTRDGEYIEDNDFQIFVRSTTAFKDLKDAKISTVKSETYRAAKYDTPSSLHKGIVVHQQTGSWMFAIGTLYDTQDKQANGNLENFLSDYIQHGKSALERCDGQFALLIYSKIDNSISVVSDPAGLVSVFYSIDDNRIWISTSALAIAKHIRAEPHVSNIDFWLRTGRMLGEMTLWRNVHRLVAATVVKFTAGNSELIKYWSPKIDPEVRDLPLDESIKYTRSQLLNIFDRNLRREGKVWMGLTGGFDTRFVSMLIDQAKIPFRSFCQAHTSNADSVISKRIAKKKGWEYFNYTVPDNWGEERLARLEMALGKCDGQLNAVELAAVLWGHVEKDSEMRAAVLTGSMGELWRTTGFVDSIMRPQKYSSVIAVNRFEQVRENLRKQLEDVCSGYETDPNFTELDKRYAIYISIEELLMKGQAYRHLWDLVALSYHSLSRRL